MLSRSVVTDSATLCTIAARLLCPWDFPGKNTGESHGQRKLTWGHKESDETEATSQHAGTDFVRLRHFTAICWKLIISTQTYQVNGTSLGIELLCSPHPAQQYNTCLYPKIQTLVTGTEDTRRASVHSTASDHRHSKGKHPLTMCPDYCWVQE